jgi:hypothetical protein
MVTISEAPHKIINARKFLVENLASFKESGVGTIYIEQIDASAQKLVDSYMKAQPNSEEEESTLRKIDQHLNSRFGSNTTRVPYSQIVKEAKKLGVKVVGIDTNKGQLSYKQARNGFYGPWAEDHIPGATDFFDIQYKTRVIPSNNYWEQTILSHKAKGNAGKGIIFSGAGHNGVFNAPTVSFISKDPLFANVNNIVKRKSNPDFIVYGESIKGDD